jgi:hypothetical protein
MFTSKSISFCILVITAFFFSRGIFFFIDDPEGPNLLVVAVGALVLFTVSMFVYVRDMTEHRKIIAALVMQLLLACVLAVVLR